MRWVAQIKSPHHADDGVVGTTGTVGAESENTEVEREEERQQDDVAAENLSSSQCAAAEAQVEQVEEEASTRHTQQ